MKTILILLAMAMPCMAASTGISIQGSLGGMVMGGQTISDPTGSQFNLIAHRQTTENSEFLSISMEDRFDPGVNFLLTIGVSVPKAARFEVGEYPEAGRYGVYADPRVAFLDFYSANASYYSSIGSFTLREYSPDANDPYGGSYAVDFLMFGINPNNGVPETIRGSVCFNSGFPVNVPEPASALLLLVGAALILLARRRRGE